MKRSLLIVGAVFLLLWAALTVLKLRSRDESATVSKSASARGAEIKAFWDSYNAAEKARLRGEFQEAASSYRKALEIDSNHQDSLFYLAICLQELGKYSEAASMLERVIELYPDNNRAFTQLGTVLASNDPGARPDFDRAAELFVRSQEINREHSGAFLRQGLLELNRGNLDKAAEAFRVASGGGAPESLFLAGLTDYLRRDYPAASKRFMEVLEANQREKAISGRGMVSEGDAQRAGESGGLNAFERAGIKSLFGLYWAAHRLGGYPEAAPESFRLKPPAHQEQRFDVEYREASNSSKGLWIDYNRDNRPDLLLVGPTGASRLLKAGGGWEDVTRSAGLSEADSSWDAIQLDLDGDGWQDIYVMRGGYAGRGVNTLYRNQGGRFVDVTESWGLSGERSTAAARAADFDGDGRVDLLEVGSVGVRLHMNEGSRFVESTHRGLAYPFYGVDAAVADFDGDGWQDIYVLGWKAPGRLFRNTGTRFDDVTEETGLEGVGGDGFSVIFFDFNRDSRPDLLVTSHASLEDSLQRMVNPTITSDGGTLRLFLNRSDGRFEEVTADVGLNRCYGVLQAVSADFDADGWPDLLLSLGGLEASHLEPSLILRNLEGRELAVWTYLPSFEEPNNSRGAAVADVNGDGRVDLFLSGVGVLINQTK